WDVLYCGYRTGPGGLYYVRNRFLHSRLGGWLQRDPLKSTHSWINLYAYATIGPLITRDPYGLSPQINPSESPDGEQEDSTTIKVCERPVRKDPTGTMGHVYILVPG